MLNDWARSHGSGSHRPQWLLLDEKEWLNGPTGESFRDKLGPSGTWRLSEQSNELVNGGVHTLEGAASGTSLSQRVMTAYQRRRDGLVSLANLSYRV